MADFQAAFEITLGHEGGYANDPTDRGGETYKGVARRFHPGWPGWARVDALKRERGFPRNLERDAELQQAVRAFYKAQFWDRLKGDQVPDQPLAEKLFDIAVNMGVGRAVRFLQEAVNLLNRDRRNYADLVVDGLCGGNTLDGIAAALATDRGSAFLLKLIGIMQGAHYVEIMRNDPTQERFARGWLTRV